MSVRTPDRGDESNQRDCQMRTDGLSELAMPTAKDKGGSTSHRYRPASEYDDAALTQKRQYWRTKKREQRARLTERRGKATQGGRGGKPPHLHRPAVVNPTLSGPLAAFSSPLLSNDDSYKTVNVTPASQGGNTTGDCSVKATENQKWLHTMTLDTVLPPLPASCSISAKATRGNTRVAASRAVTSPTPSGTQPRTRSSVPPVRVTRTTNGSAAKTTTQPCASMQEPRTQHKTRVPVRIQPKLHPANVTTGAIVASPACVPVSVKTEGRTAKSTPLSGTKSTLVTVQRAVKGVSDSQSSLEPEEERAAKRREQWRIKKREQRAKLAAQTAKAKERVQSIERQAAQKAGLTVYQHLPSQSFLRGAGQRQCPTQVKTSFTSAKKENDELQSGAATFVRVNLQADRTKVQNSHVTRTTQTAIMRGGTSVKRPVESQRKLQSNVHVSNVSRGIVRCKTPRQRFIEAQKNFMNQRNTRCKSPFLASVFGTRNIPQIDPNDTPEQIIAKRREYWRIKKREQRAKLSMEMKARLKERDSLTRRVKRYQSILEEMRRARALAQSAGSTLTHASETIGGFIKEDGTVTINIPHVPAGHNAAAHKSEEEECCAFPNNTPVIKPNNRRRGITPINVTQTSSPLRPPLVKVSFPLAGQSLNKSPRAIRLRPQLESTTVPNPQGLPTQTVRQLTLTHPQTPQHAVSGGLMAVSNIGGCVMKMAVSSGGPSLLALSMDPELTEEERMAKKREYWRIKKREQRAARAARANAALQRRRAQKQVAVTAAPVGRRLINHTGNAQLPSSDSVPITPDANEIKQEIEYTPGCDLNPQPEQAICPDIKAPTSPSPPPPTLPPAPTPPPPAPQLEPDPSLSVDTQATTLLAVASMKKLLEESLSSVTECCGEQTAVKLELTEEDSEPEIKPHFPLNDMSAIDTDLMLEIKSLQPDTFLQAASPTPFLKDSSQSSETLSPLPTCSEVVTCEHSSQTTSNFIVDPSMEAPLPRRTPRLRNRQAAPQSFRSPETEKLHHSPTDRPQHCVQAREVCRNSDSPSARGYAGVLPEYSGSMSLQRKREYWKLMKRQQRARLRARQKDRQGESSSRFSQRNIQAPGLNITNTIKGVNLRARPALQPKPSISLTAVNRIPSVLLVSPATRNAEQPPDTLRVRLPAASVSCSPRPSRVVSDFQGAHENSQLAVPGSGKWSPRSIDLDPAPSLPTLTPPDNPLSSINLQPIEPPLTPNITLSPIRIPCDELKSPTHTIQPPAKLGPLTAMMIPKPIPGEPQEDFLRRKREYWRIKKKEQRARKAIRDKAISLRRASNNLRPILPAQDLQTQDSGQWASSSEDSEHLMSTSEETDSGSFQFPNFSAPVEEEAGLLFADFESNNGEEGPFPDAMWRNSYLMDYDPLNQLLVCMVCGELQYSHSLEGVRAHIEEAHPETLTLEPTEQLQILEAWDEQVSQRERFFTSQLQQHGGATAEAHGD